VEEPDATTRRAQAARLATAKLMARSKREIPHYYLRTTLDLTDALAWIRERNRELPVGERILPAALFLRATAIAAGQVSALNGFWEDGHFVPATAINLGVPVSLRGGGLITPAIADAGGLKLPELAVRMRELATRAKAGRLRGSELTGATITVTNLGDLGVELVYGVIYPPQVALVGVGRIVERPWAVDGLLGVRPVVTVTLSADHRASDGATGARFLDALSRSLSQPENL
jgi:pyruvate dehydrogenase E2 component (dihydrolipoamide acetyltransferase)